MENELKEDLEKKFYKTMTLYFSERWWPTGAFNSINKISNHLETLNKRIEESNKSSEQLASALNRLTFWGVIVAGLGVFTAIANLFLKYMVNIT